MEIGLRARGNDQRIYFTTNGSEPDTSSRVFEKSFVIRDTTAVYHRIPQDWNIDIASHYSSQYAAGGELAVIDGVRGNANFATGAWQGYQGQDFVAVVDLGKVEDIRKVGAGFLQDVGSWIWMPRRVEFELSIDGRTFNPAATIDNEVADKEYGVIVRDFVETIPLRKARYVRVKAYNYGRIAEWHPGKGGEAWIFIDEIIVQ